MASVFNRIWNLSPKQICDAVKRRLFRGSPDDTSPSWHRVRSGPIKECELFVAPKAVDTWQHMVDGTFDGFFLGVLSARDLRGKTLWDIGSHFGYHALCFAAMAGESGSVVAFEPNLQNCNRIRLHLERNSGLGTRISLRPCAVADRTGELTFVTAPHLESGESTGSHLADANIPNARDSYTRFVTVTVPAVRLDDLMSEPGFTPPAVIKIDVEGAESLVLAGAMQLLRRHKPMLLIEIHHILEMFSIQPALLSLGYRLTLLGKEHASASRCFIMAE